MSLSKEGSSGVLVLKDMIGLDLEVVLSDRGEGGNDAQIVGIIMMWSDLYEYEFSVNHDPDLRC